MSVIRIVSYVIGTHEPKAKIHQNHPHCQWSKIKQHSKLQAAAWPLIANRNIKDKCIGIVRDTKTNEKDTYQSGSGIKHCYSVKKT